MGAKKKYPEPYRREDSKIYYFVYTGKDGKRRKQSTGETAKEKAREYIRAFMDKQDAKSSPLSFAQYAAPYYLPETCPHFIRYRQEGKSIGLSHLGACRSLLEKHILADAAFSNTPIATLKRGDLLDLRNRMMKSGMGTNTVNKCISAVKTILSEACFRDDIDSNPGAQVGTIKYEKKERGVLAPEEVGRFLAFLSERTERLGTQALGAIPVKPGAKTSLKALNARLALRDEAMIAFLFCTGVRAGELRALRWSSVDLETGRCPIIEADKGLDGLGKPKWNKTRDIYIGSLVLNRLKAWKRSLGDIVPAEHFVFGTQDGKHLGYEGLHNVLEDLIAEAREADILPDDERWISCHAARHSLNTNLLAAGVAPLLVQSFLGWSSAEARILTKVQEAYTHLSLLRVEDVAKAVDQMYAPPQKAGQIQIS
jgi:integrase